MKKVGIVLMMLLLLTLLVCSTALACPNPEYECPFFSYWFKVDDNCHRVTCEWCGYELDEGHFGGEATCTTRKTCSRCREEYGSTLDHIPGAEATCTTDQVCTRDECGAVLNEKLGHTAGAEATCTTAQTCVRCDYVYEEALGHDYVAVVKAPTCTEQGYTTYTCSRCQDSYTADKTGARGHWYDLWYPNPDGTHSAACRRNGCNYAGTAECTLYEINVKDGEADSILTICPVCGNHEGMPFAVISEAVIKAADGCALPRGEQIVRGMEAPFNGVLYGFTVAYEFAGRVEPFQGTVSVTMPLDAEKYTEFKLVRVDAPRTTEQVERTEVWTDIAFTYENGELIFETDVAGLFLLLSVQ